MLYAVVMDLITFKHYSSILINVFLVHCLACLITFLQITKQMKKRFFFDFMEIDIYQSFHP